MSVATNKGVNWPQVAGLGLLCSLAIAGCDRADDNEAAEMTEATPDVVVETPVAAAINCDNPLVQDRLKTALKYMINQRAQASASNYADEAGISLNSSVVSAKANNILIDVQNSALVQEANSNGVTTCQASISMTLASEDLYLANQLQADSNQPTLQTRLAQNNIRINNNMLVDDAFTYVVSTQGGQVRTRIAGQPPILNAVSDVVAGSALQAGINRLQNERRVQEATRRNRTPQTDNRVENREPPTITSLEPIRPIEPATPPTISQNSEPSAAPTTSGTLPIIPEAPKAVPQDDSIDMIIVEDESATY